MKAELYSCGGNTEIEEQVSGQDGCEKQGRYPNSCEAAVDTHIFSPVAEQPRQFPSVERLLVLVI